MKSISWEQLFASADGLLHRAQKSKNSYTPDLLYNLCSMAIENYFMALCVYNDILPNNHRFSDLIESANSFTQLGKDLQEDLMKMESRQEICSLEGYSREKCTLDDVPIFISTTESLRAFVVSKFNVNMQ